MIRDTPAQRWVRRIRICRCLSGLETRGHQLYPFIERVIKILNLKKTFHVHHSQSSGNEFLSQRHAKVLHSKDYIGLYWSLKSIVTPRKKAIQMISFLEFAANKNSIGSALQCQHHRYSHWRRIDVRSGFIAS